MLNSWHIALRAEDHTTNRYRAYDIQTRHSSLATSAVNGVWIGVGSCKRAL
jgi:hypothetical protein